MKKNYTQKFAILLLSLFTLSCVTEENEPGTLLTGNIGGYVSLTSEVGTLFSDLSGVTLTIEDAEINLTATSDAEGKFLFTDVPMGTYLVVYSKSGFGTYKRFITHTGGGTTNFIGTVTLSEIPETNVDLLEVVSTNSNGSISFNAYLNTYGTRLRIRLFASTSQNVSNTNYEVSTVFSFSNLQNSMASIITSNLIGPQSIQGVGSGSTVYVKAYVESFLGSSIYTDPASGLIIYPSLSTPGSNVVSYIIP